MKSKMKKLLMTLTTSICTIMALSISASACAWAHFQPEEPECLKKR